MAVSAQLRRRGAAGIESPPANQWYAQIDLVSPDSCPGNGHPRVIVHAAQSAARRTAPLSDHEQRMLHQIESALYAEDPKSASRSVAGAFRAMTAWRKICRARRCSSSVWDAWPRRGVQREDRDRASDTSVFGFVDVRWCGVCHHRSCIVRQMIVADRLLASRRRTKAGAHSPASGTKNEPRLCCA